MEDDATHPLRPEEVTALRTLLDPHPGYAPPLDTVAFLLRRDLVTLRRGMIEITEAGRNVLAANHFRNGWSLKTPRGPFIVETRNPAIPSVAASGGGLLVGRAN